MNQRLLELYKQAQVPYMAKDPSNNMPYETTCFSANKFAELIIKSVMADLEKQRAEYANPDMYESVEYYDSMRAKESALEDALDTIQYNFGVEE